MKDELVCYYIVNSELNMSPAKIAVQVAHVATKIALNDTSPYFCGWLDCGQKKIILRGKQKDLERLVDEGFYYIRDNGLTEIPADSLTCVGLGVMTREEAQKYIKRLQLYK